ncbi:MAG: hypothetical protein WC971_04350 [Coriobacteriia bacterium]
MGLIFSYDIFRQVCAFSLIRSRAPWPSGPTIALSIGDGYGFLSALIKEVWSDTTVCLVDLGKTLLFQAHHLGRAFPGAAHVLFGDTEVEDVSGVDFVYCPAERLADWPRGGAFSW